MANKTKVTFDDVLARATSVDDLFRYSDAELAQMDEPPTFEPPAEPPPEPPPAIESPVPTAPAPSVSNQFADEETSSSYTYPKSYRVKEITKQVRILRQIFPELKDATYDKALATRPLPPYAEGWFAIPRWQKLGGSYGEVVDKVLAAIEYARPFSNLCKGRTGPEHLRQHRKTVTAFQKLGDEQKGHDILIVPCQFGLRYRDRSVRRARELMNAVEFGLGAFAVGCMILTHPKREVKEEQLHVDCAGDEFSPDADGIFSRAPIFLFHDGWVEFHASGYGIAHHAYGSASAFLSP